MLRRALAEASRQLRLAHSDAGSMVDRRIVTKLLVTYIERGRADRDVLGLMARMLGFTVCAMAFSGHARQGSMHCIVLLHCCQADRGR